MRRTEGGVGDGFTTHLQNTCLISRRSWIFELQHSKYVFKNDLEERGNVSGLVRGGTWLGATVGLPDRKALAQREPELDGAKPGKLPGRGE